jgi:hypothetical protein
VYTYIHGEEFVFFYILHRHKTLYPSKYVFRAVGRSENPGVSASFGGHYLPLLVEIGSTDLPKFEGAMASPGTKIRSANYK